MNYTSLKNIISNNKLKSDETIRDIGTVPVNQPVKMYITDFSFNNGFANISTATELGENQYVEKNFSFKSEGRGRIYLEKFLNTAFPDQSTELTTNSIIGKAFIGKVVMNEGHENLEAVGESEDVIVVDDSLDGFIETDKEESPFV